MLQIVQYSARRLLKGVNKRSGAMTSSIRRRILGDPSPSGVTSTSPAVSCETSVSSEAGLHPEIKAEPVELSSAPVVEHQHSKIQLGFKRRTGLIFILGGLFGLLFAGFIANRHDVISLEMLSEMNLEYLMDVIPVGILNDAKAIQVLLKLSLAARMSHKAVTDHHLYILRGKNGKLPATTRSPWASISWRRTSPPVTRSS